MGGAAPPRPVGLRGRLAVRRERVRQRPTLFLLLDAATVFLGTWLGIWLVLRFLVADPDPWLPAAGFALFLALARLGLLLVLGREGRASPRNGSEAAHR